MTSESLDISQARDQLDSLDQMLREQPVIKVTRGNQEAFAVVDLDYLDTVLETIEILSDPDAMRMLEQSLEDIRAGRLLDQDQVRRELL